MAEQNGRRTTRWLGLTAATLAVVMLAIATTAESQRSETEQVDIDPVFTQALEQIELGRQIFRYDRMGSQVFFSRTLKLHKAVQELPPSAALGVGLKVDAEALPPELLAALTAGKVDLEDPANTVALIKLGAVVGVMAKSTPAGKLRDVGITCALCHSTVDDSVAPGIGRRLDGWANRDLDVGAVIALAPRLEPVGDLLGVDVETVRTVLHSWGPGRFDAHLNLDGKAFRPDGSSASVLIPPAFGLAGVNLHTYTGWGSVPYWNAFVGNLEMNGRGRFFDSRLDDPAKFPVAVQGGFADVDDEVDVISAKLAPLHLYQLALLAPPAPLGSYDVEAAQRGGELFRGPARCSSCHVPPLYTEPGHNLHRPDDIGIDDFHAMRSPTESYRTTPLRGLWTHTKGGFYHDGRFATLLDVVDHYDGHLQLGLNARDKADLVEFLRSL